uniref:Uncharacterized protein n=1 Tax=Tetranychus urticae TaxID=32264 RepID=T1JRN0_TETUR
MPRALLDDFRQVLEMFRQNLKQYVKPVTLLKCSHSSQNICLKSLRNAIFCYAHIPNRITSGIVPLSYNEDLLNPTIATNALTELLNSLNNLQEIHKLLICGKIITPQVN